MFDRFLGAYPVQPVDPGWESIDALAAVPGYREIASRIGGQWTCGGMYRLLDAELVTAAGDLVATGFPSFAARAVPFGVDWLGRLTAIDRASWPALLLIEPGSGQAFDIDETLDAFFNVDLVDDPDTYLEAELHAAWLASGGRDPKGSECVGFKVPPFLGGAGAVSNLELVDMHVYWGLLGQLSAAAAPLPPGTTIGGVSLGN